MNFTNWQNTTSNQALPKRWCQSHKPLIFSIYINFGCWKEYLYLTCDGEKGTSTWITALFISDHTCNFAKAAFKDTQCLQHGWMICLPSLYICADSITIDHTLPDLHNSFRWCSTMSSRISAPRFSQRLAMTCVEPALPSIPGKQLPTAPAATTALSLTLWQVSSREVDLNMHSLIYKSPSLMCVRGRCATCLFCMPTIWLCKVEYLQKSIQHVDHATFFLPVWSTLAAGSRNMSNGTCQIASKLFETRAVQCHHWMAPMAFCWCTLLLCVFARCAFASQMVRYVWCAAGQC